MYWQLEIIFFETENYYHRALSFWKLKYGKMEYRVNLRDRICSTGDGKKWIEQTGNAVKLIVCRF